jgi:hypothetical protein
LVLLYADTGNAKFEPAAVRWVARLALEGRDVRLVDLQRAVAVLAAARGERRADVERTLLGLT